MTLVYRDTWGVPHIYAPTVEEGLYAMGWAQAQDRPEELLLNILRGMGELASVKGPEALNSDRVALMWDLYAGSRAMADRITPDVRLHTQALARGINAYYAEHPEDLPTWWGDRAVDEFMVIAYGRMFLQSYSFDDGIRDLIRAGIDPGIEPQSRGSNEFVIGPNRSAVRAPILLSDMHLSWGGPYRFWEFRIHAGELRGSGFTLPGLPYIGLGHNEHVAWAMTTGGPDTADAFELELQMEGTEPARYLYEGRWRNLARREYKIQVRGSGERTLRIYDAHHGPLVAIRGTKGYAVRSSYADVVDVLAPWREFNFAKDVTGVKRGLDLLHLLPHNAMVADDSGNIYYQRTGRVPRRPAGHDGSRPIDGSTSKNEWLGLHPASDLLQVTNPSQGYMQNCNVPPDAMMENSPFSLNRALPYLYADLTQQTVYGHPARDGWTNSRGARTVELLKADSSITVEEAIAIALDIRPFSAPRWVEVLARADARFGPLHRDNPGYEAGIRELKSWNFELAADSRAALEYAYWRQRLRNKMGTDGMRSLSQRVDRLREPLGDLRSEPSLTDEELRQVVESFAQAMQDLRADFGDREIAYGDLFRVGCGDVSWPSEGGMAEPLGLTTLRSVGYGAPRADHTRRGERGQTSTGITLLARPIRSWTCVPLGQSARPHSPHFCDQAEELFSPRRMKPTWWTPEELADQIESRTVLSPQRATDGAPSRR